MSEMFTYSESRADITVKLDGKVVGKISRVPNGWQFTALNRRHQGKIFGALEDAKESLETE